MPVLVQALHLYMVKQVIYEVLRNVIEDFFVFVPLHTPEAWQFSLITGDETHVHIVKIIVEREKHPHIRG